MFIPTTEVSSGELCITAFHPVLYCLSCHTELHCRVKNWIIYLLMDPCTKTSA